MSEYEPKRVLFLFRSWWWEGKGVSQESWEADPLDRQTDGPVQRKEGRTTLLSPGEHNGHDSATDLIIVLPHPLPIARAWMKDAINHASDWTAVSQARLSLPDPPSLPEISQSQVLPPCPLPRHRGQS
jgi:hypothetical protein